MTAKGRQVQKVITDPAAMGKQHLLLVTASEEARQIARSVDQAGENYFFGADFIKNQIIAESPDAKGPVANRTPKAGLMAQKRFPSQEIDRRFNRIEETVRSSGIA